ncbi:MAG TPA: hypothetical protein VFM90_05285 [Cyclobacteriaceae bacterium]|nr:hypothetical protein [Cyclobacteriaceae bacterium]
MNAIQRQYLFGLIFFGVGVYYIVNGSWLEASLYLVAGLAFVFNALVLEPKLAKHKKPLTVISWILIIGTGLLLLYLIQFHWF